MNPAPPFQPFGMAHTAVIVLVIVVPIAMAARTRGQKSPVLDRVLRGVFASLLIANYIGYVVFRWRHGTLAWAEMLPLQLCDWTMFVVIVALINGGRREWLGIAYFWGIGGSLQAIITPNLAVGFPDFRFLTFFLDHGVIVIGIIYLMMTRRFRPTSKSIWQTVLWSEVYFVVTIVIDLLTGMNYGFLLHKPEAFSILNYLSDFWPLYILQMHGLAYGFFAILYLPFAVYDLIKARGSFVR
jgi:hypothetical integral membrane protein (TIGR02206 family)